VQEAKRRDTRAMLQILDGAIEDFRSEAPVGRIQQGGVRYADRYGLYPPDEIEAFSPTGIPHSTGPAVPIGVGRVTMDNPPVGYNDVRAMVLAIRTFSPKGTQTLEQIHQRFKAHYDVGQPGMVVYWDRDNDGRQSDRDDVLDFFVDAWGTPIQYFAVNPTGPPVDPPAASDTVPAKGARLAASKELVRANNGRPVLVSYGPDGKDQLSGQFPDAQDIVTDWWKNNQGGNDPAGSRKIDNRFNVDNVYSADGLAEKLRGN
jgi:hypothetical protein